MLYQPNEGTVLCCDFSGFIEPEMIKTRPVIVVKKHRTNSGLVTVVPLSLTPPSKIEPYHFEFPISPAPNARPGDVEWAKCDMVVTISIDRLDRFKTKEYGQRIFKVGHITQNELASIKDCIRHALGL